MLLRLGRSRGAGALLVALVLLDTVVRLAVRVVFVDKREALHLSEQVLEFRVLVATVAATNVVEPTNLAEEIV